MAGVLCRRASPWLRAARGAVRLRFFSTAGSSGSDEPYIAVSSPDSVSPRTVWPDETMGPFGPQDKRFQLPGNVGFDCHLGGMGDERAGPVHRTVPDVLSTPTSSERHEFVLAQFISEYQNKEASVRSQRITKAEQYFTHSDVECSMHSCPELLKHELGSFFSELPASPITVVTVKQKETVADTKELDREQLLNNFINGAKEICFLLWQSGYWADFIDPSSGKAFFGSQSPDSVLQIHQHTHAGFQIEDVASCTLTVHVLKGEHTFAGTLITNAPSSSPIMERLRGHTTDRERK